MPEPQRYLLAAQLSRNEGISLILLLLLLLRFVKIVFDIILGEKKVVKMNFSKSVTHGFFFFFFRRQDEEIINN